MFTARVPGHGLVEWTADEVDEYATKIRRTHLPRRHLTAMLRGRNARTWAACREAWPCMPGWWAERHLASTKRCPASANRADSPLTPPLINGYPVGRSGEACPLTQVQGCKKFGSAAPIGDI